MPDVQAYVDRLSGQPLPVWQAPRRELLRLAEQGGYNAAALTRGLAHDPLLCAQLLRLANRGRAGGSIATLEQAAVMLGARALSEFAQVLPVLEDWLSETRLQALRQLQRQAFHTAYLARALTFRFRETHYEDAFFAGLLQNLGAFALRASPPPGGANAAAGGDGVPDRSAPATDIPALTAALARHWRLPPLLSASLEASLQAGADGGRRDRRAELVYLAGVIVREGPVPLQSLQAASLQQASVVLGEPAGMIRAAVFVAMTEAAKWLDERLPASQSGWVELFPSDAAAGIGGAGEPPVKPAL